MRLKFPLIALAAVIAIAAAGYTAYWFLTARQLAAGLQNWAAAERARGYDIVWSQPRVTGFPTRFRIVVTSGAVGRGNPAAYRIAAPKIAGEAAPWDLNHWLVAAPQGATATVQGIEGNIDMREMTGEVALGAESDRVTLMAYGVTGQGARIGETDAEITLPRRPPQNHDQTGLAASIQLYHLTLPQPVRPLGKTIESLLLNVAVKGALPPGEWRQALTQWSKAGGTVEIQRAAVQWGALVLQGSGTLALDDNLQPEAAMTASIVNHDALIDAAVTARMLRPDNAAVVKLVLDLLAKRGPDGRKRLTAPVTIQNETLYIGNAKIGKVPAIPWR